MQQDDDERSHLLPQHYAAEETKTLTPNNNNKPRASVRILTSLTVLLLLLLVVFVVLILNSGTNPDASSSTRDISRGGGVVVVDEQEEEEPEEASTTTAMRMTDADDLMNFWDEFQAQLAAQEKEVTHWFVRVENETADWTEHEWHALQNNTLTVYEMEYHQDWWHNTQAWFRHAWESTADGAHEVWLKLSRRQQQQQQRDGNETTTDERDENRAQMWWNKTVHTEREWFNHTLVHLHTFGTRVKSWWNHTSDDLQQDEASWKQNTQSWWNHTSDQLDQDERVVEHNFQRWWQAASEKERQWWNQTVQAATQLEHAAADQSKLWWNMTRAATERTKDSVVETEQHWWNVTARWFATKRHHRDDALSQPLLYLNSTRAYSLLTSDYGWYDDSSDFFHYQQGWDVQINQAYCAVASVAAVLNSLRSVGVELPVDPAYEPHPYATQASLLSATTTTSSCVHDTVIRFNTTFQWHFTCPVRTLAASSARLVAVSFAGLGSDTPRNDSSRGRRRQRHI